MRASRFVEPNIARLSPVQTHRKRADNLPASSVQSSSSTRPAQLQAREIQSACGHRGWGHPTRDHDIRSLAHYWRRPRSIAFSAHHRAWRHLSQVFLTRNLETIDPYRDCPEAEMRDAQVGVVG